MSSYQRLSGFGLSPLGGLTFDASNNATLPGSLALSGGSKIVVANSTPNGSNDALLVTGRGAYGSVQFVVNGAYLTNQSGVPGRTASYQANGAASGHYCDGVIVTEGAGGGAVANVNGTCNVSVATGSVILSTAGGSATFDASGNMSFPGYVSAKNPNVAASSTSMTVTAAQSGTTFNNASNISQTVYNMPVGAAGLRYRFMNYNATAGGTGTKLQFQSGDAMFFNNAATGANRTATSNTLWAIYDVECVAANTWSASLGNNWTLA